MSYSGIYSQLVQGELRRDSQTLSMDFAEPTERNLIGMIVLPVQGDDKFSTSVHPESSFPARMQVRQCCDVGS